MSGDEEITHKPHHLWKMAGGGANLGMYLLVAKKNHP